jgi:hypothetical protein
MGEEMMSYSPSLMQAGEMSVPFKLEAAHFRAPPRAWARARTRRPVKFGKFRALAAKPRGTVKTVKFPLGEIL